MYKYTRKIKEVWKPFCAAVVVLLRASFSQSIAPSQGKKLLPLCTVLHVGSGLRTKAGSVKHARRRIKAARN